MILNLVLKHTTYVMSRDLSEHHIRISIWGINNTYFSMLSSDAKEKIYIIRPISQWINKLAYFFKTYIFYAYSVRHYSKYCTNVNSFNRHHNPMAVGAIITFIVQMRRLRHRGVEWSAHGHKASEWEHADLNPDRLAWKFTFLTKMLLTVLLHWNFWIVYH